MLDPQILAEYNELRKTPNTDIFCHAPFASINFEQNGNATVCCYNRAHVLGTYPNDSLGDMWYGAKADQLRTFMMRNVLPASCKICHDQFQSRNFGGLKARFYDQLSDEDYPETDGRFAVMPKLIEFELSNVCNLECTMCNGYFSSSIRKHRERRPPLKSPYDDRFVRQLEPFIPHLREAKFLGGEPFLIKIYYQIWELIARINPDIDVTIVTNGTVLNDRVKDILGRLKAHINVSIDSLDPANYERIRVNSQLDSLMENFQYFREYVDRKNTDMSVSVCPMQQNWRDIPRLVEFCNEREVYLFFNTVLHPEEASLRTLSHDALDEIIESWQSVELDRDKPFAKYNDSQFLDLINQVRFFRDRAFHDQDYGNFQEEDIARSDWSLRVADGNVASLEFPDDGNVELRIPISKAVRSASWDIQLNRAQVSLKSDRRYAVVFRARADRPRRITFGVAKAYDPWDHLGLYKAVDLTPEWQRYAVGFVPTNAEDNARLHFDVGESAVAVDLADITLRSQKLEQPVEQPS